MRGSATFLRTIGLALFAASALLSQPVPAAYQDLYSQLKTRLDSFDAQVTRAWDGATFPTDFGAELLTANGNRGQQLLSQNARTGAVVEMEALRSLGVRAVTIALPYPLLNRAFLQSIGRASDYDTYLSYFQFVVNAAHDRNMRVVIENGPMFTGVFSANAGFDVGQHYRAVNDQQYIQGRAEMAGIIARDIQPDYLQLGAEPDTEAQLTDKPSLITPSGYANLISAAVAQIRAAGMPQVEVGAGVGTWLPNGRAFIDAFAAAGVTFIDLHLYPINRNFLDNLIDYTDHAYALGKKVTICEAWLLKIRDSELGAVNVAADPATFARDAFSFWMPLDQQFIATLVKFSHWKQLALTSAYWSKYLFAYLPYESASPLAPADIINNSSVAAANAIVAGQSSPTGGDYKAKVSEGTFAVSNSSYRADVLAPGSIVSVFGVGFASGVQQSSSLPLPSSLLGTSATVTDSQGRQSAASFYLTAPNQVNLVLPSGLAPGRAVLRVAGADGRESRASLRIGSVGPGLSAANANGRGVAAALVGYFTSGTPTWDFVFTCSQSGCMPASIDVNRADQVYLLLFGTGFRNRSALNRVVVKVGGVDIQLAPPNSYAGPQDQYPGLDQINVQLPRSLAGRGDVAVMVTVDGLVSNALVLNFR